MLTLFGILTAASSAAVHSAEESGIEYTVEFEGLTSESGLDDAVKDISTLNTMTDKRPASLTGLRRRADEDAERIKNLLKSKGYYAADVSVKLETGAKPVRVSVAVASGPLYRIGAVEIDNAAGTGPAVPVDVSLEYLGIKETMPGEAKAIADARSKTSPMPMPRS